MNEIYFKYRGKDSRDMGIAAAGFFEVSEAVPNVEQIQVPGKSGALTYWDGTYAEREIVVPSFLMSEMLPRDIAKINSWLIGSQSFDKLILSDDPEHFFLARAVRGVSTNTRADVLTPLDVVFESKPQRYLASGETERRAASKIYNPTDYTAHPIWLINAESDVTFAVNGNTATISGIAGKIRIDTETGAASHNGDSVSASVVFAADLTLAPGVNVISIEGGTVSYIPRWWEL